jgi:polar amino acid transport system substrate-binding protein
MYAYQDIRLWCSSDNLQSLTKSMPPSNFATVEPGYLHIISSDFDARPMSQVENHDRQGYEPALTRLVCEQLGLKPVWHNTPMQDFYSQIQSGSYDVVWFNQAITPERQNWVDFTHPYGLFDEAVLVRADSQVKSPADLSGQIVGGLADSTNMALAETFATAFADVKLRPFAGSDKVLPEMLAALRAGEINALIDDELVLVVAAEEDPKLRLAFTVPTRVPFAIGVKKGNVALLNALNATLESLIADSTMATLWAKWIPWKPFPLIHPAT